MRPTKPRRWNRDAERAGVPLKIFSGSMCDVFEDHPQVTEPRKRLWDLIEATPWLRWQLLTKRPENMTSMAPWGNSWPAHVWAGTSVENQRWADARIPVLAQVPAAVRFRSCEPLLGPIDLSRWLGTLHECPGVQMPPGSTELRAHTVNCCTNPAISWLIVGGESGPRARPMRTEWARSIVAQCRDAGIAPFVKQLGSVWARGGGYRWEVSAPLPPALTIFPEPVAAAS